MSLKPIESKRLILPRWRNFKRATYTGELASLEVSTSLQLTEDDTGFQKYKDMWLAIPGVDTAADFVFYCAAFKRYDLCQPAAKYLRENSSALSTELKNLVDKILSGGIQPEQSLDYSVTQLSDLNSRIFMEIQRLKVLVKEWPKGAIYWVELARLYAALGVEYKATKSIEIALHLAPRNRYVLRSAIRYFAHINDFDSLSILFRRTNLYNDPWILSAYLALHDQIKKKDFKSKLVKNLIERLPPVHTTELSSAMASLELDAGAIKSAKKLFQKSVIKPNDNSLAQLSWAQTQIGIFTDISQLHVAFDHELRARECFRNNDVKEAIDSCIRWLIDEPFSALPSMIGSFISATHAEDYQTAKQFCDVGLRSSPNNKMLINNKVVCLARTGELKAAIELFNNLGELQTDKPDSITYIATAGLLAFRSGLIKEGREYYHHSITLAKKFGIIEAQALAAINLAREEFVSGQVDKTELSKILDLNITKDLPSQIKELADSFRVEFSKQDFQG